MSANLVWLVVLFGTTVAACTSRSSSVQGHQNAKAVASTNDRGCACPPSSAAAVVKAVPLAQTTDKTPKGMAEKAESFADFCSASDGMDTRYGTAFFAAAECTRGAADVAFGRGFSVVTLGTPGFGDSTHLTDIEKQVHQEQKKWNDFVDTFCSLEGALAETNFETRPPSFRFGDRFTKPACQRSSAVERMMVAYAARNANLEDFVLYARAAAPDAKSVRAQLSEARARLTEEIDHPTRRPASTDTGGPDFLQRADLVRIRGQIDSVIAGSDALARSTCSWWELLEKTVGDAAGCQAILREYYMTNGRSAR